MRHRGLLGLRYREPRSSWLVRLRIAMVDREETAYTGWGIKPHACQAQGDKNYVIC